jgi:ribonuclease P protein component
MLAATQRLRHSADFAAAIRGGRRAGRGTVVVHLVAPVPPELRSSVHSSSVEPAPAGSIVSPACAGFVVSKAVGNAVVRNRVRRRLRHLVRERLAALPPAALLVVRAQPSAATAPSAVLGADLDAALAAVRAPRRARPPGQDQR